MTTLRATEIFNDSKRMLIAVEAVELQQNQTGAGCHLYVNIEPMAVIVCSDDGIFALDMEAGTARLEQLSRAIPELDAMIASFNNMQ